MIKLKESVDFSELENYGFFKENRYHYKLTEGALNIFCDIDSRKIYGVGFYSVGQRIVMEHLKDLGMGSIVDVS